MYDYFILLLNYIVSSVLIYAAFKKTINVRDLQLSLSWNFRVSNKLSIFLSIVVVMLDVLLVLLLNSSFLLSKYIVIFVLSIFLFIPIISIVFDKDWICSCYGKSENYNFRHVITNAFLLISSLVVLNSNKVNADCFSEIIIALISVCYCALFYLLGRVKFDYK